MKKQGDYGMKITEHAAVVLNYKTPALTIKCVENLKKQDTNLVIVVVDNNSMDSSCMQFNAKFENDEMVVVIESGENAGYANGNNLGIQYIKENYQSVKFITIVNPDVELKSPRILSEIECELLKNHALSVLSCLMIFNGKLRGLKDFGWKFPSKKQLLFSGTFLGKWLLKDINDDYESLETDGDIAYVDVVPGCFFTIKADDLFQIGGFDNNTFLYFEETILARKIKKLNKKEGILLSCRIRHNHVVKDAQLKNFKKRLFDRKCFYDSKKYYINHISEQEKLFILLSNLFNDLDFFLKKIIYGLLSRLEGK